jgi:hypothetical protein
MQGGEMLPEPDDCTPAHPDTLGARNPLLPAAAQQRFSAGFTLYMVTIIEIYSVKPRRRSSFKAAPQAWI